MTFDLLVKRFDLFTGLTFELFTRNAVGIKKRSIVFPFAPSSTNSKTRKKIQKKNL